MSFQNSFRKFCSAVQSSVNFVPKLKADSPFIIISANASSGQKGTTRNYTRVNRKRHRGVRVSEGDRVHSGYHLVKQISRIQFYPGANVQSGKKNYLTALCSGTIRFTKEIFIPSPKSPEAEIAATMPQGAFMYKTFVNVVPDGQVGNFKLVETV